MRKVEINFDKVYDLAQSRGEVDLLESNLFTLYILYRNNYELRRLFHTKGASFSQKIETLAELSCFAPCKTFYELVYLLLEKEMWDRIFYVNEGFGKVVNQRLGRIIVQTFSAEPLSDELRTQLTNRLAQAVSKKVILKNKVDENLVGGLIVKFPNGKIYDFSIRRILSDFKFYLMEKN